MGIAGTLIGTGLVALVILLTVQTIFVAYGRLGKRIALHSTWAVLVMVAADAMWDVSTGR